MYSIKIGSLYVVLDDNSTLSLERNNPLFATELLPGDWSLPFTVPDCPTNDIIFNLPKDIANIYPFEADYNAQLYIGDKLYSNGRINVTRTEKGRYNLVFGNEISRLKSAIEGKKLNEFDYGGVRTFGTTSDDIIAHAKDTVLADPLVYDYVFPTIYNDTFYGEAQVNNPYYLLMLNVYNAAGAAFKKNVIVTTESAANKYALAPQPYLQYIIKRIFAAAGFLLAGDFMNDSEMKKLLVYSNYAIDKKTAVTHHSKAILSTGYTDDSGLVIFDNDSTGGGTDLDNDYNNATGEYTIPEAGYYTIKAVIDLTQILPRVNDLATDRIDYTITLKKNGSTVETAAFFSFWDTPYTINKTFSGYFTAPDIGAVLTIEFSVTITPLFGGTTPFTVNILPNTTYVDFTVLSQSELNKFNNDINVANHVPDMLATDFLISIFGTLLIKMKPDAATNTINLNYADKAVKATSHNDLTKIARPYPTIEKVKPTGNTYNFTFPSSDKYTANNFIAQTGKEVLTDALTLQSLPAAKPNSIIHILNSNRIYASVYNTGTLLYEWVYVTDNYFPLKKGDGTVEVKPNLSPLIMAVESVLSVLELVPAIGEPGTSLFFANGLQPEKEIRLMFYRGMQPNAAADNYPLATTTMYDYAGNIIGTVNLQWDGDNGLYNTFHKAFFEFFTKARLVTHTIDFTPDYFTDIDMFEKQLIDRQLYFINRIRINLKPNSIEAAMVETYSVQ